MTLCLTLKKDDYDREPQIGIAEALYDVDSSVEDPRAYTSKEPATLHSQIMSILEQVRESSGGKEQ